MALLEAELERVQLERGARPPPAAAAASPAGQAPRPSPLASTLPAAVPLPLAASPEGGGEAASPAGTAGRQALPLPVALSGVPEESSRELELLQPMSGVG